MYGNSMRKRLTTCAKGCATDKYLKYQLICRIKGMIKGNKAAAQR